MTALAAYEAGLLDGATCWLRTTDGDRRRLPVHRWAAEASTRDDDLVDAVVANLPTGTAALDIGCGPGRLTRAIVERGVPATGLDSSAAAVALARERGVPAVHADVWGAIPDDGGWGCVLLADGNIGIGGDPERLLRRVAGLVVPGGAVVADVAAQGGVSTSTVWIEACRGRSPAVGGPMPWAWVGADAVHDLARAAGLQVLTAAPGGRGVVTVWRRPLDGGAA